MQQQFDVCVWGAGPAGAAVALRLADLGLDTLVLDRPAKTRPWGGESLTGSVREPLAALGLWESFCQAGHVAGYEQRIAWGGEPWVKASIFASHGPLWHVDRARFDGDLRAAVRQRGVPIRNYRVFDGPWREGAQWRFRTEAEGEIRARYLVDATGRARALARRLGVRARVYDRLTGFTALLPRNLNPEFDHAMVIESNPLGWWYAAPVPQGHVLAFFTDTDLAPRPLTRSMRVVAAHSAFAQAESEQGWVAVGDACAAHDPLCGWGVHRALANGIRAADAIGRYLREHDVSALDGFRRHCHDQFAAYLAGLTQHYSYEKRWTSAPFWERRARAIAQPV
jgi:flavin-dependent dehydrogenase